MSENFERVAFGTMGGVLLLTLFMVTFYTLSVVLLLPRGYTGPEAEGVVMAKSLKEIFDIPECAE